MSDVSAPTAAATAGGRPADAGAGPVLEIVDYSGGFRHYGGELVEILKGVSFLVPRSSITAIVGETGSGKTLSVLSVLGLLPANFERTSGSIWFEGEDLASAGEELLRRVRGRKISMVFQDPRAALNPVFTVGKQLSDVCRLHRSLTKAQATEAAIELLEQVRVPEPKRRMRQYPHEFSGGMAQRAGLAMALACRPSLLLLDEPTTGLDVTIQAEILDLIVELARDNETTVCIITHDLGVVAAACDSVVVMRDGEVCETGSCEHVLTSPQSSYTQALIADSVLEGIRR